MLLLQNINMAEIHLRDQNKDPSLKNFSQDCVFSRCPLVSFSVPRSRQLAMCRILKPFVKHFDALADACEVVEKDKSLIWGSDSGGAKPRIPPYTVTQDQMSSPAIAIMLFMPEIGRSRAEKVRLKFQKSPWQLHHSIQMQKQNSLDIVGKQEFYFLSRRYPLWSVCTAPHLSRVLRVNIFVRRFSAMVEFYRLVTGSEMESSKPGFCVFTLNTQNYHDDDDDDDRDDVMTSSRSKTAHHISQTQSKNNTSGNAIFELALKQCSHINPFSINDAYLTFPVPDIISLRTILHNYIRPLTSTHYLVHDPDGNPVVLYDLSAIPTTNQRSNSLRQNSLRNFKDKTTTPPPTHVKNSSCSSSSVRSILASSSKKRSLFIDKESIHSESLDSGRFSDYETLSHCTTDLEQCMAKLFPNDDSYCDSFLEKEFGEEFESLKFENDVFGSNLNSELSNYMKLLNCGRGSTAALFGCKENDESVCQVSIGNLLSMEEPPKIKTTENRSSKKRK